jgi:chromosome segregation protein
MRLKRLEIKGFKSFANETVINFDADVIGIVGPNGSGKSNIVDAIRWVLGEQKSRELRLDQMTSVIFNGTKKRKAGGVAQVALTFENTKNLLPTEYHTVTIARLLYRSGESEYRLNGVTCRLKDITSLFLDTGIGSNSYAIIALGMVDDILADKDNSRRKMFEQAAGISKYKLRKRETLNKLKSTSADLDRVEDLLFEIESNLKTLEKQAKRTKRYFELKEEYKNLSIDLALIKVKSLKEKHHQLNKQLQQEQDSYRQLEVESSRLEAKLEAEKKANLDKEKALSARQRELNSLVGSIRAKENDRRMLEQKKAFIEQNRSKLEESIRNAQVRNRQLQEDIEHYRSQLNGEKRLEVQFEEQLDKAEEALAKIKSSHGALKSDLDVIVKEQQAVEREVYELEKKKAINVNQMENGRQEMERNSRDIAARRSETESLRGRVNQLKAEEKAKNELLENLEKTENNRQAALQEAEGKLEQLTEQLQKLNRELDAKRNEYKLTKSMVENLEGFPESIRFLSSSKEWKTEAPLLSDLIYVKEAYRVAIENYLEPYLNYYVVNNLEEAYQAITLLGRSQKGKANFFILDAFRTYLPPMTLIPDTQQAIDLVETDPIYRNLCSYLLENVLITTKDDLIDEVDDPNVVLLSQDGRFIRRKYSVSGGSIGLFEGKKIGRKKNLEILDTAISKAEREENRLSTAFYNQKNKIEQLKAQRTSNQIQQERQALNRLMQSMVSLETRLENFETFIQEADDKKAQTLRRMEKLEKENQQIDVELAERQAHIQSIKSRIANTDDSYRLVAEQLSEASTAFNQKNIEFIRQQNKVTALQQELSFREKQLEETQHTLKGSQKSLKDAEEELKQLTVDADTIQATLLEAYEERKKREASLTEAEQKYFQARGGINELEDNLRKINKREHDLQILINNLKDKFSDVKYEISSVAQRLRIEFEADINDHINQEVKTGLGVEELEIKVDRLRSRLSNYGEINPMAVEAFDEMKDRYDNITEQRDDIVKAKESLIKTIQEIEETATAQFLSAFEEARLHFIDVFRSLFTQDDNCDLILLDPENPLESKIEIVAKPKGKRPQTISQLSGGEKTLTATALLFALYLLKPAPFCIFDEVDAPLDDANINKFNRIIKKFSQDSQFVIVTHNKLTMAAVDTIYGVYMAEQGVSGVSPVDFRDFEHTASFEISN